MSELLGAIKLSTGALPPTTPEFAHPTAVGSVASKPPLLTRLVGPGVVEVVLEVVLWSTVSIGYDAELSDIILWC